MSSYARFLYLPLLCGFLIFDNVNSQKSFVESNQAFAESILKDVISKFQEENVLISPYLIQRLMTLPMFASKGIFSSEIKKALRLEQVEEEEYLTGFKKPPDDFMHVCKVYYHETIQLLKPFLNAAEKYVDLNIESTDLHNTQISAEKMNSFIENTSKRQLRGFIKPSLLSDANTIVFVSVVSFKGQWHQPFNKYMTRMGKFLNLGKSEVDVTALYGVLDVGYTELINSNIKAVQLMYKNSNVKMVILLPIEKNIKSWPNISISEILDSMHMERVAISLPKFEIDMQVDFSSTMVNLGVNKLFGINPNAAKKILPESKQIQIISKSIFEVNEYGSKVDLQTETAILKNQDENEKKLTPRKFFVVERPFFFALHSDGIIHLTGRVQSLNQRPI